jgi:hypothetical protein
MSQAPSSEGIRGLYREIRRSRRRPGRVTGTGLLLLHGERRPITQMLHHQLTAMTDDYHVVDGVPDHRLTVQLVQDLGQV